MAGTVWHAGATNCHGPSFPTARPVPRPVNSLARQNVRLRAVLLTLLI